MQEQGQGGGSWLQGQLVHEEWEQRVDVGRGAGISPFQDPAAASSFRLPPLQGQCATPGENSTTLQSTTQPPLCSHLQFMNSAPPPAHPPRGKSLSAASPWLLSPRRFPVTLGVHKQLGSMTQTKGQLSLSTLGHLSSLGSALLPCPGSISNT